MHVHNILFFIVQSSCSVHYFSVSGKWYERMGEKFWKMYNAEKCASQWGSCQIISTKNLSVDYSEWHFCNFSNIVELVFILNIHEIFDPGCSTKKTPTNLIYNDRHGSSYQNHIPQQFNAMYFWPSALVPYRSRNSISTYRGTTS